MQLTKHWAAALDDYVIDLSWSPDGLQLAAASAAGPVWIFATADGAKRHVLPGHDGGTNAIAFAPAAGSVAGVADPGIPGSPSPATASPLLASGGQDGAVKLWDAAAGQHVAAAALGSAWVEHLAWTPGAEGGGQRSEDGSLVLAAAAGRNLTLLNPDGTVRHAFKPAPKTITALIWRPSSAPRPPSSALLAVAWFGGVCLWNARDFSAAKEYAYNNGIHALAWSPDAKWLVSGNQDPSVHLWIPSADDELHMSGYESKVKYLSFDHTSRWLATGGGRDACIWDCSGAGPEGREPLMFPHEAPVCAVAFQHTHGLLATASQDGVVMLWSPERQQPLRATVKMPAAATKLLWSPDDRFLAIGSEKGAVYVLKAD
jgi:WD40 repeat protein